MTNGFQLGSYVSVPSASPTYVGLLNNFEAAVGATPTVANEAIDYSKPMSAWVSAATSAANWLAASPGGTSNVPDFALPLMSTSDTTTTALQAFNNIASGADDAIWTGIVKAYQTDGFTTMYLRPGWEMNGNWMPWSVTNATEAQAFVAAFQHIADVVRAVPGIQVKMLWNPADLTNSAVPTASTYPGDNYVDVVATDIYSTLHPMSLYDWSTGKTDTSIQQWWANPVNEMHYWDYPDATQYRPQGTGQGWGLVDTMQFAVAHGKPIALAEAGAGNDGVTQGQVDNGVFPEYLAQRLLAAGAPTTAFATIWERAGTVQEFAEGNHPLETAAWADFVKKMMQGDAGPTTSTAAVTAGHNLATNLLASLNGLIAPGRAGDTETISHISAAHGTVSISSTGAIVYTAGAAGTDTLTYTVTDQLGDTIVATTSVTVDGGATINAAATKVGHGQTVTMASLSGTLVAAGLKGDVETFSHVTAASGTVSVAADGTISYTAPASGTDTLSYTVTDQFGDSVTGSSTITVDGGAIIGAASVGVAAGAVVSLGSKLSALIAPGLTGDKPTITSVTAATGTVVMANGVITYTAPASGHDTVTYTVTDQLGDVSVGTYNFTVNPASVTGTVAHFGGATDPSWGSADIGVTVSVVNAAGAVVASTVSGGGGWYSIGNLLAGSYQLRFTAPNQAIRAGTAGVNATTGLSTPFTLVANQAYAAGAMPMVSVGSVAGQVLANGAGDAGVTVNLLSSTGTVAATTLTDAQGNFTFTRLAAGSYQIGYAAPSGMMLQAGGPANVATGLTAAVAVVAGQTTALAAETLVPQGAVITGTVIGNGVAEAGVSVSLLSTSGSTLLTTTTGNGGVYSFNGLTTGSYAVKFAAPAGQVLLSGSVASPTTGVTAAIAATSGQTTTVAPEALMSAQVIQGQVFHFGSADPSWGTGQFGVTVSLLNAAGTSIATTTSAGNGWFSFGSLGAGSYQLQYTLPTGEAFKTGGFAGTTGLSAPVTLAAGQNMWLPAAGAVSSSNSFALTGTGSVALRSDGSYAVTGNAVSSRLVLGNGSSSVTLGGSANTVTIGDGNQMVALSGTKNVVTIGTGTSTVNAGSGNAVVHAAGGNVTITAGGANNLFDSKGIGFMNADGSAGNTFMMNAAGQGLTTIAGFNPATTDVLDLARTLSGTSILPDLSNLGSYVTAVATGSNTTLYTDVDNAGHAISPIAFATLTGVNTSVASLVSGHHISMV